MLGNGHFPNQPSWANVGKATSIKTLEPTYQLIMSSLQMVANITFKINIIIRENFIILSHSRVK